MEERPDRPKDQIDELIAAYRSGDAKRQDQLERRLTDQGHYITYGPAGVMWAEPGWDKETAGAKAPAARPVRHAKLQPGP
jgi:hypothetical protein